MHWRHVRLSHHFQRIAELCWFPVVVRIDRRRRRRRGRCFYFFYFFFFFFFVIVCIVWGWRWNNYTIYNYLIIIFYLVLL